MTQATIVRLAAFMGGLAVVFGAFAAHGLKARIEPDMLAVFEVGVRYQMYHAISMLAVGCASGMWASPWTKRACIAWTLGVAVFSGSLYALALTHVKSLGAITPFGGVAMILGWGFLVVSAGTLSRSNS